MTTTTETVCGKEPCCLNPAQCDAEESMMKAAPDLRSDFERLADCMSQTSEVIAKFRAQTIAAATDIANGVEAMKSDIEALPNDMQKSWLTYYVSAMQEVSGEYAKVLGV